MLCSIPSGPSMIALSLYLQSVKSLISLLFIFVNNVGVYNAFNVYCRELAPGTVSLTGYRAQGDDGKHCAYCKHIKYTCIYANTHFFPCHFTYFSFLHVYNLHVLYIFVVSEGLMED